MYNTGDLVVHYDYGICRITGMRQCQFPGQKEAQNYYEMIPVNGDEHSTVFFTQVDQSTTPKLRDPLSTEEINEMIDMLPDSDVIPLTLSGNRAIDQENMRTTYTLYRKSGKPIDLAVLLKTIYTRAQKLMEQRKRISEYESRVRDEVEFLFFGEIAVILGIERDDVITYISERISNKELA